MDFAKLSQEALSIEAASRDAPHNIALCYEGKSYTYEALCALTREKRLTLKKPPLGRPYVLVGRNTLETFLTIYALLEEKIPFLLLHPTLTALELEGILHDIDAITDPVPEDTAAILLTSGTTGKPKPAMLSRAALTASAYSSAVNIPLTANDAWLMSISASRIGGLSILTRSLAARSRVVSFPHFCAKDFIAVLEKNHVTLASLVPTMLVKLMDEFPEWKPREEFRTILLGGSAASQTLLAKAKERGIPIVTTYGMTETASNIVTSPYAGRLDPKAKPRANALAEIKIEDGTLRVRGPMRMTGYWGHPPLAKDAWFDTGDIAEIATDGSVQVYARRTDLIVSGGENVYPAEVEAALTSIPSIKAALVLGLPDATWGAVVTALLVSDNEPLTDDVFKAEAKKRLSPFKCPRRIAWVKTLPQNSAGKPERNPTKALAGIVLKTLHYTR